MKLKEILEVMELSEYISIEFDNDCVPNVVAEETLATLNYEIVRKYGDRKVVRMFTEPNDRYEGARTVVIVLQKEKKKL